MKHAEYTVGDFKPPYASPWQLLKCRFGKHVWHGWGIYAGGKSTSEYWCYYCEEPIRRRAVKGNNPGERPKRKHVKR